MAELTPKQDKFARCIASGTTQSDAYRIAYDAENMLDETIWSKASILANDDRVKARVSEYRSKEFKYTREQSLEKLKEIQDLALSATDKEGNNTQLNPALKAEELKGKLSGLYIDKTEDVTDYSSLLKQLGERAAKK